jgi:succinoglycan biosynthesis transport protein ExoP
MSSESPRAEDMRMDLGALLGAVLSRWLRILIVTVLLLGATFAVLMFIPKMYESSASILVEQRSNAFTRAADDQPASSGITIDALLSSQIELIKSRDTLLAVIDTLNLRSVPELSGVSMSPVSLVLQLLGRKPEAKSIDETVLENLNSRVTVLRERDSAVISVYVRSESPKLAADIANAIAAAHVKRRADLSLSDTAEASVWLEQEIAKLRDKVSAAENAVADYRSENDLFDGAGGGASSATGTGSTSTGGTSILDQQLSAIALQITATQERKNTAQSRANLIRGLLDGGQPIDAVPDVQNSLVIQNLIQSKATLQGELAQRSSTLLGNHPTIKALKAQIASIETQIAGEGRKVAQALEAEAEIEGNLEASLNDDLARMKLNVSTATKNTVTLESLQREAKAQRDLLESYLARYSDAAARTDSSSALPDVRVVTLAAPAVSPASPKTGLILGAVGFIALALQIGAILFGELMSGRAITTRQSFSQPSVQPVHALADEEEPALSNEPRVKPARWPGLRDDPAELDEPLEPEIVDEADIPEDAFESPAEFVAPFAPPVEAAAPPAPVEPEWEPELEFEPELESDPAPTRAGAAALELSNLSADIAIGRVRVVMLAALGSYRDVEAVAETLIADALHRGLSVATIDAGSGRLSVEPGLSDLTLDRASFGDVVHKIGEGLASVPWGHQPALEKRSMKPVTLIEALTDIYEVVIVTTGKIGMSSALPIFSGVDGRLVLVAEGRPEHEAVEAALSDAASLGYEVGQMVSAPAQRSVA